MSGSWKPPGSTFRGRGPLIPAASPFDKRVAHYSEIMPLPRAHPDFAEQSARARFIIDHDIDARLGWKAFQERQPCFVTSRARGGSGLRMSHVLRTYFVEYYDRWIKAGPDSFPSSFNVVESFLEFSTQFLAFDLRKEREHLLKLRTYLEWYADSPALRHDPGILVPVMEEGVVYAYDMLAPVEGPTLRTADSELLVLGITFIRHAEELSVVLLAGESPAFPPDEEVASVHGGAAVTGSVEPSLAVRCEASVRAAQWRL